MGDCQICGTNQSKYSCPRCRRATYCSLPCYGEHKGSCQVTNTPDSTTQPTVNQQTSEKPTRPLTSLKWPYVPEESAYSDPLKRDDPKVLQLHQYEAIATSPAIRKVLASNPSLKALLNSIDKSRGQEREQALQTALGVASSDIDAQIQPSELGEEVLAFRELAEAVEAAVRGENKAALGLDWCDTSE